jgi:hypothetical protein
MNDNLNSEQKVTVDLEELFQGGGEHPSHDPGVVIYYKIKVDKMHFERKEHKMSGRELLALVNLTPEKYRLFEIGHGQQEIGPDEKVDFRKVGIERFKSLPKEVNEGKGAAEEAAPLSKVARRNFELPAEDTAYLNKTGWFWETILSGPQGWVLIHDLPIPTGYNVTQANVAFLMPASYPTTEFDMMYLLPTLQRTDQRGIRNLFNQPLDGSNYQGWSRHRVQGAWRAGIDNVETHVLSVMSWLKDELQK